MPKTVPASACWLFRAITFKRLRVLECKRPFLKLDVLSFMGTFESFNLDKNWKRNSLGKRRVLHSQNCRVNAIWCLFICFLFFSFSLSLWTNVWFVLCLL
uniref:Uncharacterized protein n=1 Tax=Opuntia streptacantha TaxID=393608 RepID=A0A7C9ES60_OPUST